MNFITVFITKAVNDYINGIGPSVISFIIGFIGPFLFKWFKNLKQGKAKKFWKPLTQGKLHIVVPRLFNHPTFKHEQIGVIAAGTVNSLFEIGSYLKSLNIAPPSIVYADLLGGDQLETHLIVLGGPTSNEFMKRALDSLKLSCQFDTLPNTAFPNKKEDILVDRKTNQTYTSSLKQHTAGRNLKEVERDYAIIIKATHPFCREKQILHIAGLHDYSTWAGVKYVMSDDFLHQQIVKDKRSFEMLIQTDVVGGTPQNIKLVLARELRS
ncbi:MAG TPA: hypothetical protein VFB60_06305 [Ktedonobacteraceae bacterium]|nr:hypothetical protein [Ktedonobacteraceae bacterium]